MPEGLSERDFPVAVMVGEVKGILQQLLAEVTTLSQRVQSVESGTNSRLGELERTVAALSVQFGALTQQHIDDMRRLAESRATDRAEQLAAAGRRPSWTAIVSVIVALLMAGIAVLSLGDVIGANG